MKKINGFVYMVTEKSRNNVKVGFTTNINQRMRNYATHSTTAVFIDFMTGTNLLEAELINRLEEDFNFEREYTATGIRTDFFKVPKEYRKAIKQGFTFFNEG